MYYEIAGFISLMLLVFFTFASYFRLPPLGIIATVLLFLFGMGIIIDGIQLKSGELTATTTISPCADSCMLPAQNITNLTTTTITNQTFVYSDPPPTPFINYNYIIGFILICLSIYSGMFYVMQVTE